jgi:hypothetical protein
MVAYSFQPEFCQAIVNRAKTQTIRAERRRHAKPGEQLQLYRGMRTAHCRKIIPDPVCTVVERIRIWVPDRVTSGDKSPFEFEFPDRPPAGRLPIDGEFAYRDGFGSVGDMLRFWRARHGPGLFDGVLIQWRDREPDDAVA